MTTTVLGRAAEELAAAHVQAHGFVVVNRNWRNRWCEIDLVARGADGIHFVEVKYRRSQAFGASTDYVTAAKRERLKRAALAWCVSHAYDGTYHIDVVAVEGPLDHARLEFIADVAED